MNDYERELKRRKGVERDNYIATVQFDFIDYNVFQKLANYLFQEPDPINYVRLGNLENALYNKLGTKIDRWFAPLWERIFIRDYPNVAVNPILLDNISFNPYNEFTYWKRKYEQQTRYIVKIRTPAHVKSDNFVIGLDETVIVYVKYKSLHVYDINTDAHLFEIKLKHEIKAVDINIEDTSELFVLQNIGPNVLIKVYNLNNSDLLRVINVPLAKVHGGKILVSGYDSVLIFVDVSSNITIINHQTGNVLYIIHDIGGIISIAFNNNRTNPQLFITTYDGYVIYDLKIRHIIRNEWVILDGLHVQPNRNGTQYITYNQSNILSIWNGLSSTHIDTITLFILKVITDASYSTNNRFIVIGTITSDVYVYDTRTKEIIFTFNKNHGSVVKTYYLQNGHIFVLYKDGALVEWDPTTKMLVSCSICSNIPTHVCSNCLTQKYCSKICQKTDWLDTHKINCQNINVAVNDGVTALMMAAQNGNIVVVNLLIQYGADIHVTDNMGRIAADYAYINGHYALARQLGGHRVQITRTTPLAKFIQ